MGWVRSVQSPWQYLARSRLLARSNATHLIEPYVGLNNNFGNDYVGRLLWSKSQEGISKSKPWMSMDPAW